MIYIGTKFLCCILLLFVAATAYGQPALTLRQKLERILQDPEYRDADNEIQQKSQHVQGMLLRDQRENGLFDTSSEERPPTRAKTLRTTSKVPKLSNGTKSLPLTRGLITTTSVPNINTSAPSPTTTSAPPITSKAQGGFESLSSIFSKLLDIWTKSL